MCFLLSAGHDSEIAIKWQWARWVAGRRSKCASVVNSIYMFVHIYKRRGCCHYRSATTTANYAPNAVPPVIAAASVVVLISASKQPRHFNSLLGRIFTAANTQMLNSSQLNLTKLWSSVVILVCLCVCMCVCVGVFLLLSKHSPNARCRLSATSSMLVWVFSSELFANNFMLIKKSSLIYVSLLMCMQIPIWVRI